MTDREKFYYYYGAKDAITQVLIRIQEVMKATEKMYDYKMHEYVVEEE